MTSTFTDPASWYASLPTMYGTAAALITSPSGEVLLVKPNYRDHWSLPGGILEEAEAPEDGCAREVREEIGLDLPVGPLLTVQWLAPAGERPKPMLAFLFDGGVLDDFSGIVLQKSELDDYRLVQPSDMDECLPPHMAARVCSALRARETGVTVYRSSLTRAARAAGPRPMAAASSGTGSRDTAPRTGRSPRPAAPGKSGSA